MKSFSNLGETFAASHQPRAGDFCQRRGIEDGEDQVGEARTGVQGRPIRHGQSSSFLLIIEVEKGLCVGN